MAAHKGYGLAVLVEILASVMTGAGILSEITSWNLDLSAPNNAGHAFIAIDISKMLPMEEFTKRINKMAEELKNSPKASGAERIFLPGEMEWDKRELAERSVEIEITASMAESFAALSNEMGIELEITE